jgi:hypothetical protein
LVGCVGRLVVFPVRDLLELDPVSGKGQDRANLNLD